MKMTEKEAKKELYSFLHSKKLEEKKLEDIEEVRTKLTKITTFLSGLPNNTKQHDKFGNNVAILIDLMVEHVVILKEEEYNLIKITKKIQNIEQPFRNILYLRFVKGLKIEDVSDEIDKDYRYTKKLIKKAIIKYTNI